MLRDFLEVCMLLVASLPPSLSACVQDAWEYHGVGRMSLFVLYFAFTVVFIGWNWSENTVSVRSDDAHPSQHVDGDFNNEDVHSQAVFHAEMMNNMQVRAIN